MLGYIGIMEKKNGNYYSICSIVEKQMETTISGLRVDKLKRDGKAVETGAMCVYNSARVLGTCYEWS